MAWRWGYNGQHYGKGTKEPAICKLAHCNATVSIGVDRAGRPYEYCSSVHAQQDLAPRGICPFPNCGNPASPGFDSRTGTPHQFCSKAHAIQAQSMGSSPATGFIGRGQVGFQKCAFPGCNKPTASGLDHAGYPFEFCSRSHALDAQQNKMVEQAWLTGQTSNVALVFPPGHAQHRKSPNSGNTPQMCLLPGCNRSVFVERGVAQDYCSRAHAQQALHAPKGAQGPQAVQGAAKDTFDPSQVVEVGNYVLFWEPPAVFCQWTPSVFHVDGVMYDCMEMYMMAEKARLFGDHATLRQVLAARADPKHVKALGRHVRGFDLEMWDRHCMEAVVKGNLAKFTQNPHMREKLIATRNMALAEASPYDTVWGIGLRADDPDCKVPSRWRGSNRLGCALMVVREQLGGGAVPRHLLPASMLPLLDVKLPAGLAGPTPPGQPGPTGQSSPQAGAARSNIAAVEPTTKDDEGMMVQSEETETSPSGVLHV